MWTVHKKLGELWFKHSYGNGLSQEEETDFKHCLDANMRIVQRLADLENHSYIASLLNDTKAQHEICKQIDKIHEKMGYPG